MVTAPISLGMGTIMATARTFPVTDITMVKGHILQVTAMNTGTAPTRPAMDIIKDMGVTTHGTEVITIVMVGFTTKWIEKRNFPCRGVPFFMSACIRCLYIDFCGGRFYEEDVFFLNPFGNFCFNRLYGVSPDETRRAFPLSNQYGRK